jgi:hypothetical protein
MTESPPPTPSTPSTPPTPPMPGPAMDYESPFGQPVDRDLEHLKILAICWYVESGVTVLMGCIPLIYMGLGIAVLVNPAGFGGGGGGAPAPDTTWVGWMFALGGGCVSAVAWIGAFLGLLAGRALAKRRRLMLCYVAAALACLQIPFGTVLGIFTFLVLARPSVKVRFS